MNASSFALDLILALLLASPVPPIAADEPLLPAFGADSAVLDCQRPEGYHPDAPCEGLVITVDTTRNVLYLFRDAKLVDKAPAATGMNQFLVKGSRKWLFRTPHGRVEVLRKIVDPVWTKPDWAFVEEGRPIPPADHPSRRVRGVLGKYALDLGDGILIHGTRELDSLGKNASHGCIRLGPEMLALVYREASVGTPVYVF
jgi:L,D-transpeptidase ErfK/SrfK